MTVEKFLTPEQQRKLDIEKKAEEERLSREHGDNARERALDMMMGGVLEVKKEDELKKVNIHGGAGEDNWGGRVYERSDGHT